MRPHLFKELLRKYREVRTSPKETKLVDDWYESFGEESPLKSKEQKKTLRNELYTRIVDTIYPISDTKKHPGRQWLWISGIAASALLITIAGFILQRAIDPAQGDEDAGRHYVEREAELGKLKKLLLPDSTEIWLNAGTKVGFFMPFGDGAKREVTLIAGEAFFHVKPDSTKPFIVHAAGVDTEVLGTSFTVKSYQELDELYVSVSSGKVQVTNHDQKVLGILHPGEEVVYSKATDTSIIRPFDAASRDAWMTGTIYLSEVSFAELALVFRNVFSVQLQAGTSEVSRQRYSIQLDRNIQQMDLVRAICAIHKNQHRKEEDAIIIY